MKFRVEYLIRFQHCDPAGIVFYPRYIEILNQVVEDWFSQELDWPFASLAYDRREGIPMVHTSCEFFSPSRIGEIVLFELTVTHLGRSSFSLAVVASCDNLVRMRAKLTAVYATIGAEMKGIPIPTELRKGMERYLESAD